MTENIVWRVLPWRRDDAYTTMAIDKTIAESVAAGGPPTIRFYQWTGNGAVSFAKSESIDDIKRTVCDSAGLSYVRRFTEGGPMYHSSVDLTYAVAVPVSLGYNRFTLGQAGCKRITRFLESLKLEDITHVGFTSLLVHGKKISGSVAYYEQKKALFQHGSVFCNVDYPLLSTIFSGEDVEGEMTTISTELGARIDGAVLAAQFQRIFLDRILCEEAALTDREESRIEKLRQEYASEQWMLSGTEQRKFCNVNRGIPIPEIILQLAGLPSSSQPF